MQSFAPWLSCTCTDPWEQSSPSAEHEAIGCYAGVELPNNALRYHCFFEQWADSRKSRCWF